MVRKPVARRAERGHERHAVAQRPIGPLEEAGRRHEREGQQQDAQQVEEARVGKRLHAERGGRETVRVAREHAPYERQAEPRRRHDARHAHAMGACTSIRFPFRQEPPAPCPCPRPPLVVAIMAQPRAEHIAKRGACSRTPCSTPRLRNRPKWSIPCGKAEDRTFGRWRRPHLPPRIKRSRHIAEGKEKAQGPATTPTMNKGEP